MYPEFKFLLYNYGKVLMNSCLFPYVSVMIIDFIKKDILMVLLIKVTKNNYSCLCVYVDGYTVCVHIYIFQTFVVMQDPAQGE